MPIVPGHNGPRLGIILHTTEPQLQPLRRELTANAEEAAQVIQAIAVEVKVTTGCQSSVNGYKLLGWLEAVSDHSGLSNLLIEGVSVMGNNNVSFLK